MTLHVKNLSCNMTYGSNMAQVNIEILTDSPNLLMHDHATATYSLLNLLINSMPPDELKQTFSDLIDKMPKETIDSLSDIFLVRGKL